MNGLFLSTASAWEVGIRVSISLLPIILEHAAFISTLPFHPRDPFDRILVAQSLTEGMPIIPADPALDAYSVVRFW